MRDFVITTESNSDLPAEFIRENQIGIIPHYYTVDDEVYGDKKELSSTEFYQCMRDLKKVGTMASNLAVIRDTFTAYAEEEKDVLHISFSSALSGGCGNVQMTASEIMKEHPQMTITVVDTLSASLGEALLIMRAVQLKKEGRSMQETAAELQAMIPHVCVLFTVEDLNYLYRGGRLSKASALFGTMVNIKPILYVNDEGRLVALAKTRGRKKSLMALAEHMAERLGSYREQQITVGLVHGDCEDDILFLKNVLEEKYGFHNYMIQPIGPSIGAHSGPGAVGLIFLGDHR